MPALRAIRPCLAVLLGLAVANAAFGRADGTGRRFQFDRDNVPGWMLMSSAERTEHHQRLMQLKTLQECRIYMEAQRARMEERAAERDRTLRPPRFDVCDQMKAKGLLD